MPKLGLIMVEGTITKWHKAEGDFFKEGEVLFEVETEKIVNDIEATFSGKLIKGNGVTAALLKGKGIRLIPEESI